MLLVPPSPASCLLVQDFGPTDPAHLAYEADKLRRVIPGWHESPLVLGRAVRITEAKEWRLLLRRPGRRFSFCPLALNPSLLPASSSLAIRHAVQSKPVQS